jgi:guanine deaminase
MIKNPVNAGGSPLKGVRGQILTFKDNPFLVAERDCYDFLQDGLIVIQDGHILNVGDYATLRSLYPNLTDIDRWDDALIMPGFIDCHVHYVQSPMIGSFGDTLLHWLNNYTFPTESRFRTKEFADEVARMFFRQTLSHGTTTANVFSTTFPESVDALFEESERLNARTITGKVLQDRNLPEYLRDSSAEESILQAEALLNKWHGRGRQLYAVIPRFAPTSTPEQLRLAGELYQAHINDGVYLHTHLDESVDELEWVKSLYPDAKNYTEVYDRYDLIDRRSVMAHCCIVKPEEWQRLSQAECGIAHCPSSNLYLGDGQFRYWEAADAAHPCNFGIGSDVGAGTNFSILRQLGDAYKVGMIHEHALTAVKSYYMATLGGARALHLDDKIGSIRPGMEADLCVIDLKPSEFAEWRLQFTDDIFEKLFILQTLGLDNTNRATYLAGRLAYSRH